MNNNQNYQQSQPKKKSNVGLIILIVFLCLLPIIILIGVMLMSLGVLMYNRSADIIDVNTSQMTSLDKDIYNARYESYIGEDKTRSHIIGLIQMAKVYNLSEDNHVDINIVLQDGTIHSFNDFNTMLLRVNSNYDVSIKEYSKDGYISLIEIKEK